jgi:hypothetical protein
MSNYSVSISEGQVSVSLNEEMPETDIEAMLTFDNENAEALLETHAGIQAYWEALAIRMASRYENFKDVWHRKWWAHSNVYARAVLSFYGDNKPTVATIEDMSVQIYSMDISDNERQKFAVAAYGIAVKKGYMGSEDEHYANMYRYLLVNPPWYFETVVETLKRLEEHSKIVQSVAKKLNSQAFHLDLYGKIQMGKRGNLPQSITDRAVMDSIGGSQ